jgi:hypothetical protein
MTGSNRRPSACKADALPAELILRSTGCASACVATGRCVLNMPSLLGDPYGIRTRVTAVKGRCLNRLTNGPTYNNKQNNSPVFGAYA